ncbi:MAG: hypothetical protein L3J20_07965 [Flavobacteriaceae bacterium]|nr:hypothetical protein [Flavobacteriaceae bacterium]
MSLIKNIVLIFSTMSLLVCSCKKKSEILNKNKNYEIKDKLKENNQILSLKYFDTILNSDTGKGVIKYDIRANVEQFNIVERYIIMYTLIGNEKIPLENTDDYEKLDKEAQGAFLDTIGDGTFYFDYKFAKAGKQYLTIAFVDLINFKDSINNDISPVYHFSKFSIPVLVVDSSSVLGIKDNKHYYIYKKEIKWVKRKDSLKLVIENQRKVDSMKRVLNNK